MTEDEIKTIEERISIAKGIISADRQGEELDPDLIFKDMQSLITAIRAEHKVSEILATHIATVRGLSDIENKPDHDPEYWLERARKET